MKTRTSFGEATLVAPDVLPGDAVERARSLADLARAIEATNPACDVVVGGRNVLVVGSFTNEPDVASPESRAHGPSSHVIDVVYDGPDLAAVASSLGVSVERVVDLHASRAYVALLSGFMPGFAYLGEVDPLLVRPRLAQPRARVPAGSVGVAGSLTGVYPFASPGGWNLLGRAIDPHLFDPTRDPPSRISVLDRVTFVPRPAARETESRLREARATTQHAPGNALRVTASNGIATIQDSGRFGLRRWGLPTSGPLDAETCDAANDAVGNPRDAANIEVVMGALRLVAEADVWISIDGATEQLVRKGDEIVVDPKERWTSYLAVRGGFTVPVVLGSRSTLLVAKMGGLDGRPLRKGDTLPVGDPTRSGPAEVERPEIAAVDEPVTLVVEPTAADPRLDDDAFERLLGSSFRISTKLDRVGVRFDGPAVPRRADDRALPDPVLPGAIQVTGDGTLIALGPDSAVTGGYPVVALLDRHSRARLGRLRPGRVARFSAIRHRP
ncbi:MAG: carboxyltransferase domain-containing protein [Polyangiaceae bacterium]|nr:carboxyltransferase domain-containing protein [Polyangiaceae bacterium]